MGLASNVSLILICNKTFDVRQIKAYNYCHIADNHTGGAIMEPKVILKKQDMRYLKWSHVRNSSGTAGTFLKSQSTITGQKIYYKLSGYDSEKGIISYENFCNLR